MSIVKRCPAGICPPHRGFLIGILFETNPFEKKVSARRRYLPQKMFAVEKFHCIYDFFEKVIRFYSDLKGQSTV